MFWGPDPPRWTGADLALAGLRLSPFPLPYLGAAGVGQIAVSVDEAIDEKIQDVVSSLSKNFNIQSQQGPQRSL